MRMNAAAAARALAAALALAAPASALDLPSLEKSKFQLRFNILGLYAAGGPSTQDSFSMRQARVIFEGKHPQWADLGFQMSYEATRSTGVLDAFVEYGRKDVVPDLLGVKLRGGQTLRPFSLENLTPDGSVLLVNRSKVVEALVPGRDVRALGRDIGAVAEATLTPGLRDRFLVATAGVFNGEGANAADRNKQKDVDLRLTSRPLPWLHVGGSYTAGRRLQPAQVRDRKGLELLLEYGPFASQSEYIHARDHLTLKDGWYTMAQCWLYKEALLLNGRYEEFDPNKALAGDRQKQTSVGLSYFPAKGVRLTTVLEMQRDRVREDRGLFLVALTL